jgi:hypothetical protein
MLEHYSYNSLEGIILLLILIFAGKAFRENWKNKEKPWVLKSWSYGILSAVCFFVLVFFRFTY